MSLPARWISAMSLKHIKIFTDGACSGNPGPGGWGAVLQWGDHEKELSGGEPDTTNNRMEMVAAIKALEALKGQCRVDIYTDSVYLQKGVSEWMAGWKAKGWPAKIKNQDLWKRIDSLLAQHEVKFHWIKGHAGHPENERADKLATSAIARNQPEI
jgi:ribonuclease HI